MAWIGKWLFVVGVIHLSFGLVFMYEILTLLWSERLWNTVNGQPPREAVFWFLCTGIVMLIVGVLVNQVEREGLGIPRFVTWSFAGLVVVGVVVMPISGIWLFIPAAVGMLVRGETCPKNEVRNGPATSCRESGNLPRRRHLR